MSGAALSRRTFIGAALSLAAAPLLAAVPASNEWLLFDPESALARHHASRRTGARAIQGDRVRFARALLADSSAPARISGVSRYADFLLLSEALAEAGYRLTAEPKRLGEACFAWSCERRRLSMA